MVNAERPSVYDELGPIVTPWVPLGIGFLAIGVGMTLALSAADCWVPIWLTLLVGGLIANGWAVGLRLQYPGWPFLGVLPRRLVLAFLGSLTLACPAVTFAMLWQHMQPLVNMSALWESSLSFFQLEQGSLVLLLALGALVLVIVLVPILVLVFSRSPANGWNKQDRSGPQGMFQGLESAVVLAFASVAVGLVYLALDAEWDSLRMLVGVAMGVAYAGIVLVVLPRLLRRLVLVSLVCLHFGGILAVVASIPPPTAPTPPWWTNRIWVKFYRYYLPFTYLNNAYHFYSPDPGPPTLLWFQVEYVDADGKIADRRWVTLPDRTQYRTCLEYHRRLAMTESTNVLFVLSPKLEELLQARRYQGMVRGIHLYPEEVLPVTHQYREPQPSAKMMLRSYARHVARHFVPPEGSGLKVKGVKVYRVVHDVIEANKLQKGGDPFHGTSYWPYYQGEYDTDGKLKDDRDPFLYWLIPILPGNSYRSLVITDALAAQAIAPVGVPMGSYVQAITGLRAATSTGFMPGGQGEVIDYVKLHAGGGFGLTRKSYQELTKDGVPEEVVKKLGPAVGEFFVTEQQFLDAVAGRLTADELAKHSPSIAKAARPTSPVTRAK